MFKGVVVFVGIILLSVVCLSAMASPIGIDVRSSTEREQYPAPGSVHIPVQKREEILKSYPNKDQELYIFCESGYRAGKIKYWLESNGYKKVKNFNSWREWNQFSKNNSKK